MAQWLLPLFIVCFVWRASLSLSFSLSGSEVNLMRMFPFQKSTWSHVIVVFQTFPRMTLLLLLISSAETSSDNMAQGCWFLAVLLALGCTSGPCRAGPLHAQCKVQWYSFFIYSFCTYFEMMLFSLQMSLIILVRKGEMPFVKYVKFLWLRWLTSH